MQIPNGFTLNRAPELTREALGYLPTPAMAGAGYTALGADLADVGTAFVDMQTRLNEREARLQQSKVATDLIAADVTARQEIQDAQARGEPITQTHIDAYRLKLKSAVPDAMLPEHRAAIEQSIEARTAAVTLDVHAQELDRQAALAQEQTRATVANALSAGDFATANAALDAAAPVSDPALIGKMRDAVKLEEDKAAIRDVYAGTRATVTDGVAKSVDAATRAAAEAIAAYPPDQQAALSAELARMQSLDQEIVRQQLIEEQSNTLDHITNVDYLVRTGAPGWRGTDKSGAPLAQAQIDAEYRAGRLGPVTIGSDGRVIGSKFASDARRDLMETAGNFAVAHEAEDAFARSMQTGSEVNALDAKIQAAANKYVMAVPEGDQRDAVILAVAADKRILPEVAIDQLKRQAASTNVDDFMAGVQLFDELRKHAPDTLTRARALDQTKSRAALVLGDALAELIRPPGEIVSRVQREIWAVTDEQMAARKDAAARVPFAEKMRLFKDRLASDPTLRNEGVRDMLGMTQQPNVPGLNPLQGAQWYLQSELGNPVIDTYTQLFDEGYSLGLGTDEAATFAEQQTTGIYRPTKINTTATKGAWPYGRGVELLPFADQWNQHDAASHAALVDFVKSQSGLTLEGGGALTLNPDELLLVEVKETKDSGGQVYGIRQGRTNILAPDSRLLVVPPPTQEFIDTMQARSRGQSGTIERPAPTPTQRRRAQRFRAQ